MKKYVKVPVAFETMTSKADMEAKIDAEMSELNRENIAKRKGEMLYLWSKNDENVFLTLYQAYGKDMADTMFKGTIVEGLNGSQLNGNIVKPRGIWGVFYGILIGTILIAIGFTLLLMQNPDMPIVNAWPFLIFLAIPAYILVNLLSFDKKRLRAINEYLRGFTLAENIDVLEEQLDEDDSKEKL